MFPLGTKGSQLAEFSPYRSATTHNIVVIKSSPTKKLLIMEPGLARG